MLVFPRTLLPSWSDYHSVAVDSAAMVAAHLNRYRPLARAHLDVQGVLATGIQSEWTSRHLETIAARLSIWCVEHGYCFNVGVKQKVGRDDAKLACTPFAAARPLRWLLAWRTSPGRNDSQRITGELSPFTSQNLQDSDLLLIDAPISIVCEKTERAVYLCDFPSFLRNAKDARLPLSLSAGVLDRLAAQLSNAAEWMPFCRILGILRNGPRGQVLEALQICLRTPLFPKPGWANGLIEEADQMQLSTMYKSDDDSFLRNWIGLYRNSVIAARTQHPELDNAALAAACGPDLARDVLKFGGWRAESFFEAENNPYGRPYGNAEAFWTSVASILAGWPDRFSLTAAEINALLRKFDATYDDSWKDRIEDLGLCGLLRFTPAAMDGIRARIADLAVDGDSSIRAWIRPSTEPGKQSKQEKLPLLKSCDAVNPEPLPSSEFRGTEESRMELRDIYGDMLELTHAADPQIPTEIGFHFYEGLAGLIRKMQGPMPHPLHQLWVAAEELRFLFDAHAVWIGVPEDHRHTPKGADPGEAVWEMATLTKEEKKLLEPVRDGVFTRELLEQRKSQGMRWDVLQRPLGAHPKGVPNNSNLASVDGVLVIDVPGTIGLAWQLAVFMEHNTPARETKRQSIRFCEAILPAAGGTEQSDALRRALARIGLPFGQAHSADRNDLDFWSVERPGFQKESDQFRDNPAAFCGLYRERFRLIHTVLERVYDQMNAVLAAEGQPRGAENTLIFSYRSPTEDFICFFPTVGQALSFVQTKDDIADFLYFWQFPYPRSKAISGWVLATGACDYTEKYDSDGRWKNWISHCSPEERPGVERQLALVRKFFKTKQGQEQEFMYLVPVVLRPRSGGAETKAGPPQLQPILMASIGSSKPLALPLRRQLYDLAWQIAPAVEMALLGQMTLEEVYRREAEVKTVASFSSGIAHELLQPLNLLRTKISGLRQTTNAMDIHSDSLRESLREDIDQAQQSVEEIQDIKDTMLHYVKLRQGGGCRIAPLDVNTIVSGLVTRFASWLEVMRKGSIQIHSSLAPDVGTIRADSAQFRTMIRNLLRNADDALAGRGSGLIQVSTKRTDMFVEVIVKDDGPGMEKTVTEIKEILDRGERYSTKSLGIGLGLTLINLSCNAHCGSFDIQSQLGVGTSVILKLPVRAETTEKTTT